jgi:tripartite-type tricarboxylate transporter receptor subunit TctC
MLKEPKVRDYFTQQALLSVDLDVRGTQKFVGSEVARWGALAKSVGLTIQ